MKKVLLYYNFSYPLGGGDFLPLTFASWLQSRCELTLAVDSEAGFHKALRAFVVPLDLGRIKSSRCFRPGSTPARTISTGPTGDPYG